MSTEKLSKNVKKRRRVGDIKKILVMSSRPTSIIWIGYHGYILGDIDPACGSFTDTSCVSRGKQLMDLTTKYRYMLDQLMSTVNASGSHSRGQDLILCAYERCGLELRPKDVKLFNFYMILRGQDLTFCGAMLWQKPRLDR